MTNLTGPWLAAFEEAWASWCSGNFGIGAVLAEPDTGEVVTRGHNRVVGQSTEPRVLAGNFMAHAEMNAFAPLRRFNANGLHLFTTLEPCVMCAGTAVMMQVDHIHYAAPDELMAGFHDHLTAHHFSGPRTPSRSGPLGGAWERFARVLPLTFNVVYAPDGLGGTSAREHIPDLWDLAERVIANGDLAAVKDDGGSVDDAFTVVQSLV